jgi:hypothetical protein
MPKEVIDRANALGKSEGQPELLTFFDRKGNLIGDDTDVSPSTNERPSDEPSDSSVVTPGVEDDYPVHFDTDPGNMDPAPDHMSDDVPLDDTNNATDEPVLDPQNFTVRSSC